MWYTEPNASVIRWAPRLTKSALARREHGLGNLDYDWKSPVRRHILRELDQPWKIMSIARRDWASVGYSM